MEKCQETLKVSEGEERWRRGGGEVEPGGPLGPSAVLMREEDESRPEAETLSPSQ